MTLCSTETPMITLAKHPLAHINTRHAAAWALWLLLALSFGAYMYSIVHAVINITLRQELTIKVQNKEALVSDLESQYLARANTFTEATLVDAGLVELTEVTYLPLRTDAERLSRRP